MEILIEPMLFGDYRVGVWDDKLNPMLDKEYFCRGLESAILTANLVKQDLFPEGIIQMYNPDLPTITKAK